MLWKRYPDRVCFHFGHFEQTCGVVFKPLDERWISWGVAVELRHANSPGVKLIDAGELGDPEFHLQPRFGEAQKIVAYALPGWSLQPFAVDYEFSGAGAAAKVRFLAGRLVGGVFEWGLSVKFSDTWQDDQQTRSFDPKTWIRPNVATAHSYILRAHSMSVSA